MSVDTSNSVIRSFKNFFFGTFLSRIFGFLRDVAMAFFFGASPHIATFMIAYRFANLFRRLFGESSFQASFIPYYETLRIEDRKRSSQFYRDLFFSLCFFLIIIILICEISLFFVSRVFGPNQVISLIQIMLPGLIFICLYALNSSFLQCHRNYFLPAVSPVSFNIIWIGCTILFRNSLDEKFIYILSNAIVLAFLFQYLTTAFLSFKIISNDLDLKQWFRPSLFTYEIKKLIKPISLSIVGIGALQINSALDAVFANFAQRSGPAYLWYAIRLYQLPLALFAIALSSAVLPPLTRAFKIKDHLNFKKFLNLGLSKSFGLMMPCSIALIILGPSIVNLIYTRGAFNEIDLIQTTHCLFGYSIGLSFASFVMIIASAFWAKKQYFIPTLAAVLAVVLNIVLNSVFIFFFGMRSISVAIATSISSCFNFFVLVSFLRKKFERVFQKELFISFFKISICSLSAAAITILIGYLIKDESIYFLLKKDFCFPKHFMNKLNSFFILSMIYLSSLYFFAYIIKTKEILDLLRKENPN